MGTGVMTLVGLLFFSDPILSWDLDTPYEKILGISEQDSVGYPQDFVVIEDRKRGTSSIFAEYPRTGSPTAYLELEPNLINLTALIGKFSSAEGRLTVLIHVEAEVESTILQAFGKLSYQQPIQFLIFSKAGNFKINDIPPSLMSMSSDLYLVTQPESPAGKISVEEIYAFKNRRVQQRVEIRAGHALLSEILRKGYRRHNFQKDSLLGAAARGRELAYSVSVNNMTGEVKLENGFMVEEFLYLRDSMNFTLVGVISDSFADLGEDGKLIGIGKLITDGLADFSMSSSEIMDYRVKELTFLNSNAYYRLSAYFKQLPSASFRDIYRQPYESDLWVAYFTIWATFTASAILMVWIWKCSWGFRHPDDGERVGPFEHLILTIGLVCQQGYFRIPNSGPKAIRITIFVGLLSSLVLYTAYCGSLVSTLSKPIYPITSFKDILENRLNLYAEKYTTDAELLVKDAQRNCLAFEGHPLNDGDNPLVDLSSGFSKILSTRSALLVPQSTLFMFIEKSANYSSRFVCEELTQVVIEATPTKTGMFVKKGSPLKEVFNYKILHMLERGVKHRVFGQLQRSATFTCVKALPSTYIKAPLEFRDVFTAFAILAAGFMVGSVMFLVERFLKCLNF